MSSVFISYSHNDKLFTRKLALDLRDAGHTVWIDETNISVGDSIVEKLSDAIKNVDYIIAIISSVSVNSPWVKKELELASNRELNEKRVVLLPVLLNNVQLPGFLLGKSYLDFSDKNNYQENFSKLLKKLETNSTLKTYQCISFDDMCLRPYLFIETEAHGWFRVPLSELNELNISNKITAYSYMDNLYAYLEEDNDLSVFVEAKEKNNYPDYEIESDACMVFVSQDMFSSFCGSLLSFKASKLKLKNKQLHRGLYIVLMSVAALATLLSFMFGDNIWGRFSKKFKSGGLDTKQLDLSKIETTTVDAVETEKRTKPDIVQQTMKNSPGGLQVAGDVFIERSESRIFRKLSPKTEIGLISFLHELHAKYNDVNVKILITSDKGNIARHRVAEEIVNIFVRAEFEAKVTSPISRFTNSTSDVVISFNNVDLEVVKDMHKFLTMFCKGELFLARENKNLKIGELQIIIAGDPLFAPDGIITFQ